MPEIIGIGEILIDFVATEPVSYIKANLFTKCLGGAPINTLVGISRLGSKSGAICAVGDDPFGMFLIEELKKNGIDTSHVVIKKGMCTTITFVANEPRTGERSFVFYRKPWVAGTADSELSMEDIDLDYISNAKILHVSGFALSQNPTRNTVLKIVEYAKKLGVKVSFDPTLRLDVWNYESEIIDIYSRILKMSNFSTFSLEEGKFLFGKKDPKELAEAALKYGLEIVGIKLGSKGAFIKTSNGKSVFASPFKVQAVDTTGAGDGWNAGLLIGLLRDWDLEKISIIANAVGALVVTKHGAITALPTRKELNVFLQKNDIYQII
jgi:sugar/nucleoside kinase (ribokinase family)